MVDLRVASEGAGAVFSANVTGIEQFTPRGIIQRAAGDDLGSGERFGADAFLGAPKEAEQAGAALVEWAWVVATMSPAGGHWCKKQLRE